MEHAYEALVELIGGRLMGGRGPALKSEGLPKVVKQTLKRAIQSIAQAHVARGEQEIANTNSRLDNVRSRFSGIESADQLVRHLLGS